jgi:hypothetical protein
VGEFDEFLRKAFPERGEMIPDCTWSFSSDFSLEDSVVGKLFESIGEDFSIGASDSFTNILEAVISFVNGLYDKYHPFLPEKSKESLSLRTITSWTFYHREYIRIREILIFNRSRE